MTELQPLWWHWAVLGIVLMLLELAIPAFFVIWFGAGAVVVALALLLFPCLPLAGQVALWTVCSLILVWLWFKVFRPGVHKTRIGMSSGQFAGEVGLIAKEAAPFANGQIRLQRPILGADTWECISDEELHIGDRARVVAVEGNLIKVRKA